MRRVFDSLFKKLAIPVFVLIQFGWIVYTAGFGLFVRELDPEELKQPYYFSHYVCIVGGPFVVVLGLLHAGLPAGLASSIVGVLSKLLNTFYFVSVGGILVASSFYLKHTEEFGTRYQQSTHIMIAGTVIMTVSWGITQLLSIYYEPRSQQTRNLLQIIKEKLYSVERARLLSIPAVVLSAVGWGILVGGLNSLRRLSAAGELKDDSNIPVQEFPMWIIFVVTPFLYLSALLHAGCAGGFSSFMGVFNSVFNTFTVCMSFTVITAGFKLYLYNIGTDNEQSFIMHYIQLVFAGGMVCLFFWTFIPVLSLFYRVKRLPQHELLPQSSPSPTVAPNEFIIEPRHGQQSLLSRNDDQISF